MVQIHVCEPPGDILVFLTGEEEIEDACKKVAKEVSQMGTQVRPRPGAATGLLGFNVQGFCDCIKCMTCLFLQVLSGVALTSGCWRATSVLRTWQICRVPLC